MATNVYPPELPLMILQKQQNNVSPFRYSDVRNGPPFSEITSEDTPTIYNGRVVMTEGQGAYFRTWLNQTPSDLSDLPPALTGKFNMPVRTEFGVVTQEIQFLETPQTTRNGKNVEYNFVIITRALDYGYDISDGGEDVQDIIDIAQPENGDYKKALDQLDIAVNISWTE